MRYPNTLSKREEPDPRAEFERIMRTPATMPESFEHALATGRLALEVHTKPHDEISFLRTAEPAEYDPFAAAAAYRVGYLLRSVRPDEAEQLIEGAMQPPLTDEELVEMVSTVGGEGSDLGIALLLLEEEYRKAAAEQAVTSIVGTLAMQEAAMVSVVEIAA